MFGAYRKMAIGGAILLLLIPAIATVIGLLAGHEERVVSMHVVAEVEGNGVTRITETIDYDFGAGQDRHGIFRVVPGLSTDARIEVSSPTAPNEVEVSLGRIRIGDPDVTINGQHRYVVSYSIDTLAIGDDFAWDAVGTEWDVPMESVEIHVLSGRRLESPTCDAGGFGELGGCDATVVEPGHLVVDNVSLGANEGVTIRATLGAVAGGREPIVAQPMFDPVPGAPLWRTFFAVMAVGFAAVLVTGRVLRVLGREQVQAGPTGMLLDAESVPLPPGSGDIRRVDMSELADAVTARVAPPRRLTPPEGGIVLEESVADEHQAAWLIDQAQHGAIDLVGDADAPQLVWVGGHGAASNDVLIRMFQGRSTVDLSEYDEDFKAGWDMLGAELDEWKKTSGLWSTAADKRVGRTIGLGVLLGLVATFAGFMNAFTAALDQPGLVKLAIPAIPAGLGIGMITKAWELRVRTPQGSSLWVQVEAFRRYLAEIEAPQVERAASEGLIHEYTAWAVALGESDAWTAAVKESAIVHNGLHDLHHVWFASHVVRSTSAAATTPSSSGGGGGGVGGGGGGGGGGSW